jgi:hypothetical protein
MMYRAVPHGKTGRSPAEMFLGRRPTNLLDRRRPDFREEVDHRQRVRHHKRLETGRVLNFQIGDRVFERFWYWARQWRNGVIVAVAGPLFYDVRVDDEIHRRHESQLLHNRGETEVDEELEKALEAARPLEGLPPTAPPVSRQPAPQPPAQLQVPQPPSRAASPERGPERPAAPAMAAALPERDTASPQPAPKKMAPPPRPPPQQQRKPSTRLKQHPQRFDEEFAGVGSNKK